MAEIPKVFISATSADLRTVRQTVRDALLSMNCQPVVQEHFGPDYRDVSGMLRGKIADCDALIHIAGMRYGGEPDPESLPEGVSRRSYTQMEVDLARELKLEKVFTFICPEDFPYDTTDADDQPLKEEPQELRDLQEAHRARLLGQTHLRYRVSGPDDLAVKVREIQLELEQVKGQARRSRKWMLGVGTGLAAALSVLALGVFWLMDHQSEMAGEVSDSKAELQEVRETLTKDPELIATRLKDYIRQQAEEKIAELDRNSEWAKIPEVESARDRQLDEVDGLISSLLAGLSENADPVFVRATGLLADPEKGPPAALACLKASRERILKEVDQLAGEEEELRQKKQEALRPILLEAQLHAQAFEWDNALVDLRTVVMKAPQWWEALSLLGNLLVERAEWAEANQNLRKALSVSATDEETASSVNNLAHLLESKGELGQAELLYREALDIRERVHGRVHPDTLISINNLALLLDRLGMYDDAESLYREALQMSDHLLGDDHVDKYNVMSNLALLLLRRGEFAEAEAIYREALNGVKRNFGLAHPATLNIINNLAGSLTRRGNFEEAEVLYRESLEMMENTSGRNHPSTLTVQNNLASLLYYCESYEEAERLFRQSLGGREQVLGRKHMDTVSSINNLSMLLEKQQRYKEAEDLAREALQAIRNSLGPEHPNTLTLIGNLASILESQEKYSEAEPLYRDALEAQERLLGLDHPSTLTTLNNLGFLLMRQGQYERAEPFLRKAFRGLVDIMGESHPNTMTVKGNWERCLEAIKLQSEEEE